MSSAHRENHLATGAISVAMAVLALACIETDVVQCADGSICPAGFLCVETASGCAQPEQVEACEGQEQGAPCSFTGVEMGSCIGGVCEIYSCGNGVREGNEECDLGGENSDQEDAECRPGCVARRCADGILDRDHGELCDDGNPVSGDGCSFDCTSLEVCGNGSTDFVLGEQCDDGDSLQGDGCGSCLLEQPQWRPPGAPSPSPRHHHAMVYDSARGRVVTFAGSDGASRLAETWEWNGEAWREAEVANPPFARSDSAMAYDPNARQTVLFGGFSVTELGDTWAWDGIDWRYISPSGDAPSARYLHAMTFDEARGVSVLFGGSSGGVRAPDTWTFDGTTWAKQNPAKWPSARTEHAMAYDAARQRVVLFGGMDGALKDDTWEWDGTTWDLISPTGDSPDPRKNHAMAYDPVRGAVVLFGGIGSDDAALDDTWEWDGSSWTPVVPDDLSPDARELHQLVFDAVRGKLVLFGGSTDLIVRGDTWELSGSAWVERSPSTDAPGPRTWHAMAYHAARRSTVLFGGGDISSTEMFDETWVWNGSAWSRVCVDGSRPSTRQSHAMTYVSTQSHVLLFGGREKTGDAETRMSDTWVWDGDCWTERFSSGDTPPARQEHALVYDAARDRAVLFGGTEWVVDHDEAFGDTWEWNGDEWIEVTPVGDSPSPRASPEMAYDAINQVVLLFGGRDPATSERLADLWAWNGSAWTELVPPESPSPRYFHSLSYDPATGHVVLFGGYDGTRSDQTWELGDGAWQQMSVVASPEARSSSEQVYHAAGAVTLMYGGRNASFSLGDTWTYRHRSFQLSEDCHTGVDVDGDGQSGCDDDDCWPFCDPHCPPGASCAATRPMCGDGVCDSRLESCRLCPGDCADSCVECGDGVCEGSESAATCPGDCG